MFSCGNSYVLSPDQIEDLLVDLHLAEGIALEHSVDFRTTDDKLDLYSTVYAKHNTDKAQFDSSMVYYSENLSELTEIYEGVYERLVALEVEVEVGNFTPITSIVNQDVYLRIVSEDKELLPFVQNELWGKKRLFEFGNFDTPISEEVKLDTLINRKLELRYTMEIDSLSSAQCKVTMYYDEDKSEEKKFELAVDSVSLIKNSWTVSDSPQRIVLEFNADPMNDNAKMSIKDVRLYDVASEKHNIYLFR